MYVQTLVCISIHIYIYNCIYTAQPANPPPPPHGHGPVCLLYVGGFVSDIVDTSLALK